MTAAALPYYHAVGHELALAEHAYANRLPLLLKGPTGCGKSRFVEHLAARLGRPLVTVACHDDTSAHDLLGRYLLRGGETVWQDGPLTRAVRQGAILYLDEIAEARSDTVVVLHPLSDHRRQVYLERHDETLTAPDEFMLVVSYNPGYQKSLKELKPSTRQRFVALSFDYPEADVEAEIVSAESGVDDKTARQIVKLGGRIRALDELGLAESASTRLLVDTGKLIRSGLPPRQAADAAIVQPISDDFDVVAALRDLVALHL